MHKWRVTEKLINKYQGVLYRVAHQEFDALCNQLASAGVPLKSDRDQAWRDFAGYIFRNADTDRWGAEARAAEPLMRIKAIGDTYAPFARSAQI